jgi:hypothetical protein
LRAYAFRDFWRMVSRSAFTQLRYSTVLLLAATVAMLVVLLSPPAVLVAALLDLDAGRPALVRASLAVPAWLAMSAAYAPVVLFYRLRPAWTLVLPLAAALFLAMTWDSAFAYWRGTRATWKNRRYASTP